MRTRNYVGHRNGRTEVFRSSTVPTFASHGDTYAAVVGPFRTRRGAEFMRDHGQANPHCRCVGDAEKLAFRLAKRDARTAQLRRTGVV